MGTWLWVDASGLAYSLSDLNAGALVLDGAAGERMMPVRRVRELVAGQPGTRLHNVQHDTRTLDLPVMFTGADLDVARAEWAHAFDPQRGDGTLLYTRQDATTARALTCRCFAGLEGDDTNVYEHDETLVAVLTFEAGDPYWSDLDVQSKAWSVDATPVVWFQTGGPKYILPIQLNASNVFGETTIIVVGDVQTWPVWAISGPGTQIVLTNETSGQTFGWNGTLAAFETLLLDTRPGAKTVFVDNGSGGGQVPASQFVSIRNLWALQPGKNEVTVQMSSSDVVSSQIVISWRNAYLSP